MSRSSRARSAAWSSRLFVAVCFFLAGCAQHNNIARPASDAPLPTAQAQERLRNLGLERTGNFETTSASVDTLCFAARRLELPEEYSQLRFRRVQNGPCPLDAAKWDVFRYQPEAVAGEEVGVTPELAAAPEQRASFVVAHEDFHDQPTMRSLPPGLHEPAATLAALLIAPGAFDEHHPALLYRRKAQLINRYRHRAAALYSRYRRREITEAAALEDKEKLFRELGAECLALPVALAYNPCPAVLNNAGLAFDATYTRLYPLMMELLPAVGWDRQAAIRVLLEDLPAVPGVRREPRRAIRQLVKSLAR